MMKMYYMFEQGNFTLQDLLKIKDKLETNELQYFTVVNYNTTSVIFIPKSQNLEETIKLWENSICEKFNNICEDSGIDIEEEYIIDSILFIYDAIEEPDFNFEEEYDNEIDPYNELFGYDFEKNQYAAGKLKICEDNRILYTKIDLGRNIAGE